MTELSRGRYVLIEPIAAGGMGEVWRARDTALNRGVAVKLLRASLADDAAFRSRFATEAQNAAALHDPRIATVFDYGDDIDPATGRHSTYLVMELVAGVPLSDLLTAPMAPSSAAHLVAQVADGLAVAHAAGIVHRDVKPANFLVTRDGRVKITDFGIARARGAASVTDTGTIMGTPHYVAPEIAEGREATSASDIYSLGVVLYECLSGVLPFTGDTPVAVVMAHLRADPAPLPPSVQAPLRSLVEAAMSKDPARRPPSAGAFADALRQGVEPAGANALTVALGTSPSTATRVLPALDPSADEAPTRRRTRGWIPIAAAAVVVLLIAAIAAAVLGNGAVNPSTAADNQATPGTSTPEQRPDTSALTPSQQPTTATATPSDSTTPPGTTVGVSIDPSDYIGLSSKDAKETLKGLGLDVVTEDVEGARKDVVADIEPSGLVTDGSDVTLFVYDGKSSDDGPGHAGDETKPHHDGPGNDKGKGKD
ncbi:MAG: protein kinase domain-containing protein [Nocardioidaceae bacterium]